MAVRQNRHDHDLKVKRDIMFGEAVERMAKAIVTAGVPVEEAPEAGNLPTVLCGWDVTPFPFMRENGLIVFYGGAPIPAGMGRVLSLLLGKGESLSSASTPAEWIHDITPPWAVRDIMRPPVGTKPQRSHDFELKAGEVRSLRLSAMLQPYCKVEVKGDVMASWTDNIAAIEVEYRGRPSGIRATKSQWWAHLPMGPAWCPGPDGLPTVLMLFHVGALKPYVKLLMDAGREPVPAGDNKDARVVLISVGDLGRAIGQEG